MNIDNQVAVISGATGGLGRVVARTLAEQGARLALISTSEERLQTLSDELRLPTGRILTHALNLRDAAAASEAANAVFEKFGQVNILLHLVGGWSGGKSVVETAAGEFSEMLQQHLWTTVSLAKAFVPHLVTNGWGRIIAISSPVATRPTPKSAPYAVSKAAQEALLLTLAEELKESGITVNTLLIRKIDVQHERECAPTAKNAAWTTPEEITAAILYLCSDEARVVNGARIPLYGGT
jgi:NAD(P)-dependent dehydrogenase (short-subunit alcohol dehydrogenase family)